MHEAFGRNQEAAERLLLVGAGQAADMLLREIQRTPSMNVRVVGLVDDSPSLANMSIQGYPVLGKVGDVAHLANLHQITQIVVAVPSASAEQIARIYRACKPTQLPVKILPSLAELVAGSFSLGDARDLDIKDLLGRPKIDTDLGAISNLVQGSTVLVTGAGGSIGSELVRQLARFEPGKLVLVDHDESSLYDLHERLQGQGFRDYVLCPSSILQERRLEKLFALHRPRLVFHAAAYKHVPLMELNPDQAVLTNIFGTRLVAETAGRYKVERMVNISTDKAVQPSNVMGATKRAGELIIRSMARQFPDTSFASVRFGNVLGSQGSVIPIFKGQIETGGPVVITHPAMTRYFMLIEEAVQLVIQAAILLNDEPTEPGCRLNTFVLEMGEPVSIVELAQKMIDFYWKDQSKSIGVEFSGIRPGEKLDESLTYPFEKAVATSHPLLKCVYSREGQDDNRNGSGSHFEENVAELIKLAQEHAEPSAIVSGLQECIPEYLPLDKVANEHTVAVV
jgi:FlaA1/EpsC-like NDP-sugar epimerase